MRYLWLLLLLSCLSYSQGKENQRYVIYLMNSEVNKIEFEHIQIPTIGTPKQVPIKLDTWTGDTWMLDAVLKTIDNKRVIVYEWVKIETTKALTSK